MAGVFPACFRNGRMCDKRATVCFENCGDGALLDKLIRLPKKGFMFGHQDDPVYGIRWDGERTVVMSKCVWRLSGSDGF